MGIWEYAEKEIVTHGGKMNLIESCIDRHLLDFADKPAFVFQGDGGKQKIFTYAQLNIEVNRFANYLSGLGVGGGTKKGARVFIFLPKCPEMYTSFLASIKSGNIACPLFEAFQSEGLELRLERGDADILVTNKELVKRLENKSQFENMKIVVVDSSEFEREIKKQSDKFEIVLKDRKDTSMMIFTSSTAGTPVAGIEIPHQALIQQDYSARLVLDLKEEDRYWCTAHPGWVTGSVYGIVAPLSIGCTIYILESHFDVKSWVNFLRENEISVLYSAPTAFRLLKGHIKKSDLRGVRNICSVGEALTSTTFNYFKKLGIEINDSYWQTETGAMVICFWPGLKKVEGSMGKAIPGVEAKIIDGTISLKPDFPSVMTGIYKHDKMYKGYFNDGWFRTNDSAKMDEQGYFYFIGRTDDIIKTSGERVSPIEIESVLERHEVVREAGVVGVADKIKGSILKAFIVLKSGVKFSESLKKELGMFVKEHYAGHAYPKVVEFVKSLPKTNSGKIIRAKLREM